MLLWNQSEAKGYEQLTLLAVDSPANPLVLPGSEKAKMMTVISGQKCLELYQNSSPIGSLVRTLLESSIWHSNKCVLTWKHKIMKSKRLLFQLAVSMPRTKGKECLLWRTPEAGDSANRTFAVNSRGEPKLSAQVKIWPEGEIHNVALPDVCKMWPTPTAYEKRGDKDVRMMEAGQSLRKNGPNLGMAVKMWPTPREFMYKDSTTDRGKGNLGEVVGGKLNPMWVEGLMGFPIGWSDILEGA